MKYPTSESLMAKMIFLVTSRNGTKVVSECSLEIKHELTILQSLVSSTMRPILVDHNVQTLKYLRELEDAQRIDVCSYRGIQFVCAQLLRVSGDAEDVETTVNELFA